jgi:hypothetical protein
MRSGARVRSLFLAGGLIAVSLGQAPAQPSTSSGPVAGALRYRVNYRPDDSHPWQLYTEARSLDKANTIASDVKESGYQSQVVTNATPLPQALPDATNYSASSYYPTSNWANDYNYYSVPGGGNYNYGWWGGGNPGYGYRYYPTYAWNNGSNWNSGYWRGYGLNRGWNRGWGYGGWYGGGGYGGYGGWGGSHRNWNYNHGSRGSHAGYGDRHGYHAHHGYHSHSATSGHHGAGHYGAGRHSSHHSGDHHGSHHHGNGGRTAGHGGRHAGGGHGGRHGSSGHHSGGHHGRHSDP